MSNQLKKGSWLEVEAICNVICTTIGISMRAMSHIYSTFDSKYVICIIATVAMLASYRENSQFLMHGTCVLACRTSRASNDPTSSIPFLYSYINCHD